MRTIAEGCITPDHPALAGHFPGNPIVPGVLLLSEVLLTVEHHFGLLADECSWPAVKFVAPLRPGERFTITIESEDRHGFSFVITRRDTMIASGRLRHHGPLAADVTP